MFHYRTDSLPNLEEKLPTEGDIEIKKGGLMKSFLTAVSL